MNFNYGKRFLFLVALCLLCDRYTASAQIVVPGNSSTSESPSTAPEIEKSPDTIAPPIESDAPNDLTADEYQATDYRPRAANFKFQFNKIETKKRRFDFDGKAVENAPAADDLTKPDADGEPRYVRETARGRGFNYRGAFTQSLLFLAVQHGYATTQPKTREALKHGAFWRDYADSVKSLRGWDDGGRFFTNYLAHPMQGAFTGHIYVQNSPQALREQFSMSPKYWQTRMKALLWTTAWSTQFEIGPISQASIGNVGLKGKQTWEDIIVTPTAGTAMLIGEDAIDRYVIKNIERRTDNLYIKIFARMLLNPTRNFSNLLRFREPWYRDRAMAR